MRRHCQQHPIKGNNDLSIIEHDKDAIIGGIDRPMMMFVALVMIPICKAAVSIKEKNDVAVNNTVVRRIVWLSTVFCLFVFFLALRYWNAFHYTPLFNDPISPILSNGIIVVGLFVFIYDEVIKLTKALDIQHDAFIKEQDAQRDALIRDQAIQQAKDSPMIHAILDTYENQYVTITSEQYDEIAKSLVTSGILVLPNKEISEYFPKKNYIKAFLASEYYEKFTEPPPKDQEEPTASE